MEDLTQTHAERNSLPASPEIGDAISDRPAPVPAKRSWVRVSLILLFPAVLMGVVLAGSLRWLFVPPPVAKCQALEEGATEREHLYCAQELAASGKPNDLIEALEVVTNWPKSSPLIGLADKLRDEWSQLLLSEAQRRMAVGKDLSDALELVEEIPKSSPVRDRAQDRVRQWESAWQEGQALYDLAVAAVRKQEWQEAKENAEKLLQLGTEPWKSRKLQQLLDFISTEKKAWQNLEEAKETIWEKTPEEYLEAIALVRDIPSGSQVRPAADAALKEWVAAAADIALERLGEDDLSGALEIAQEIPARIDLPPKAAGLARFGRARSRAEENAQQLAPSAIPGLLYAFFEARAVAAEIREPPSLMNAARQQERQWEREINDLLQLQVAYFIAATGQKGGLQAAIDHAATIGRDRPRRIHAQSAIAFWQKQIERIEDRANLADATRKADKEDITALEKAIAIAEDIDAERPLHAEAGAKIQNWQERIYYLRDRQTLDEAARIAATGAYDDAIAKAEEVAPEQELYADAQQKIEGWEQDREIASDRELLDEAKALVAEKRFEEAIDLANSLYWDRPLYAEAQETIQQWYADWDADRFARKEAEDRELLNEAKALVAEKRFEAAIDLAGSLYWDRPLYAEAQEAIQQWYADWDAELLARKEAEDRELLNEAKALAAEQRYEAAIELASSLYWDRPLYSEAQEAIQQWYADWEDYNRSLESNAQDSSG